MPSAGFANGKLRNGGRNNPVMMLLTDESSENLVLIKVVVALLPMPLRN
jgi:hypothetical protein